MKAYVENGVVLEICRVDPFAVFTTSYAEKFIDAPDNVQTGWKFDGTNWIAPTIVTPTQDQINQRIQSQNKAEAMQLLSATDWTVHSDVTTGTHKLTNQADFIAYRNTVRGIAVNPPTTPATFPTLPTEQWSS